MTDKQLRDIMVYGIAGLMVFAACAMVISLINNVMGFTLGIAGDNDEDSDSLAVRDLAYRSNLDMMVNAGDMTYNGSHIWYNEKYFQLFEAIRCVIGNHDLELNETTLAFIYNLCGQTWQYRYENTLVIGFNSESEYFTQLVRIIPWMKAPGVENIILIGHRPCTDFRLTWFCDNFIKNIPKDVDLYLVSGHVHIMAVTEFQGYTQLISGSGGAFHQKCSKPIYIYCNDMDWGLLKIDIKKGEMRPSFVDINGKILFKVHRK